MTSFTIYPPVESNRTAPADMTVELTDTELEVLSGGIGETGEGDDDRRRPPQTGATAGQSAALRPAVGPRDWQQ